MLTVALLFLAAVDVSLAQITPPPPPPCRYNNIDLSMLRNGGHGYKLDMGNNRVYNFAVCEPLDPWVCGSNAASCETFGNNRWTWMGRASGYTFRDLPGGGEGALQMFLGGSFNFTCNKEWTTQIAWTCDAENFYAPRFQIVSIIDCVLAVRAHHCAACNLGCTAAQNRFTSHLPIVKLDSHGAQLEWYDHAPRPRVVTSVTIMKGPVGTLNRFDEQSPLDYKGPAVFNVRGQTSAINNKKSLTWRTCATAFNDTSGDACSRTSNGGLANYKTTVMGLPSESAWVLYAPWSDKTMLRNALTYNLGNQMGRYASRTVFCEVFTKFPPYPPRQGVSWWRPGDPTFWNYQGVYVLLERVRRDTNRVNIAKLGPSDNTMPRISGGYITANDKLRRHEEETTDWFILPSGIRVLIDDPSFGTLTQPQFGWIDTFYAEMEGAVARTYEEAVSYVDAASFIDFFIVQEMTRNVDGWRWNTYMNKDRSKALNMGPLWDMDLGFWNANYYDCDKTVGWQYFFPGYNDQPVTPWMGHLLQYPQFRTLLVSRWRSLRNGILSITNIFRVIDTLVAEVGAGATRNYQMWPILDFHLWPNPHPFNGTYSTQVARMKNFIAARMLWIDSNIETVGPTEGFEAWQANNYAKIRAQYEASLPWRARIALRVLRVAGFLSLGVVLALVIRWRRRQRAAQAAIEQSAPTKC